MALKIWVGTTSTAYGTSTNWSPAVVPVTNDEVLVPASTTRAIAASNQTGVAIDSFEVEEGYAQNIGSAPDNFLQIKCTGAGTKYFKYAGSGTLALIDLNTSAITPEIRNTGSGDTGEPALQLKGTAMTGLDIYKGEVGLGLSPDDTTTEVDVIDVMYATEGGRATDVKLTIGKGVKDTSTGNINTITQSGGIIHNWADTNLVTCENGEYHQHDFTFTTGVFYGASKVFFENDGTATVATLTLRDSAAGEIKTSYAITFTDMLLYEGTTFIDSLLQSTYTNAISFPGGAHKVAFDFGPNMKFTPAAI